ncbi:serine dehydratase subunit alpha family protein [Vallitalea guaymasensis]|uniref:L-cysteine desulfidase family protein n=1 Tax=Vallitalea guaymasensis TaxID=1185412 RepID=UPI0023544F97|nr:L-serine ammonia-lyase, iron-sulfur-dependent, subunit alpha [Vallitalea guaymasensis]
MNKEDRRYAAYVQILREELVPAMGCTEPIAIAYAGAKAREVLGNLPDRVDIGVSDNIVKNVKSVVVPNTNGMKGIEASVVSGIVAGKAEKILEVISEVSEKQKEDMKKFKKDVPVNVSVLDNDIVFDIIVTLYYRDESVKVRISDYHTNIVYVEKNGEVLVDLENADQESVNDECLEENGLMDKRLLNVKDIIDFADSCEIDDVRKVLDMQIYYNTQISEEGILGDYGANIGSTYFKYYGNDVRNRAIAKAAAGSDARMSGCELPVIINSGSGNQGITVSIPVIEYAKELSVSKETLYRALVISNLIAVHLKTGIGRLSAYCGAVSAGCAAGCGIAYLQGGGYDEIAHTLVNSLAIVSGIICDGAKPSCAAKIASSVEAGIVGYHMYKNGQEFKSGDGIVTKGVEATIKNVGRLGREGMRQTDKEIVKMMLEGKAECL